MGLHCCVVSPTSLTDWPSPRAPLHTPRRDAHPLIRKVRSWDEVEQAIGAMLPEDAASLN
jgi:hypothetical protein